MAQLQRTFTGLPYGIGAPGTANSAPTNPLTLPQTGVKTLWTISGGPIRVERLFGVVTTAIPAVLNASKLTAHVTVAGADVATDLCATLDLTGSTVNSVLFLKTSFATAMTKSTNGIFDPAGLMTNIITSWVMLPGFIELNCAGSDGGIGMIQWYLHYIPLSVGVSQAGLVSITSPLS